jgi:single-strand DNA-binding protein
MNDLNQCQFIGRLGNDPEVRFTQDGKPIASISLAVGESWKDKNTGQKQEKTEWIKVVFFDGIAQIVSDYLKKGSKIFISGKMKTQKWQDKTGQDRYTTEIVVSGFGGTMQMLGSSTGNSQQQQQPMQQQQQNYPQHGQQQDQNRPPGTQQNSQQPQIDDQAIPF